DQLVWAHVESRARAGSDQVAERRAPVALALTLSWESCGGDHLGVWATHGRGPPDVVEVSVREDEMTDRHVVLQAKVGDRGQHAVRAGARVDGDESCACLDEREVAKVIGLSDLHVRSRTKRPRRR